MLRKEAVSNELLKTVHQLMEMSVLKNYRLVGGTALALQMGHRFSVDIDLFSDKSNDTELILQSLEKKFKSNFKFVHNFNSAFGKGACVFVNGIKTDILDFKTKFNFPVLTVGKIRMARQEDIIGMKLNTFLSQPEFARYHKKDYSDLACLLSEFSLERMIELYQIRYPFVAFPDRLVVQGLECHQLADKKANPKMLIDMPWKKVTEILDEAVKEYIIAKKKK